MILIDGFNFCKNLTFDIKAGVNLKTSGVVFGLVRTGKRTSEVGKTISFFNSFLFFLLVNLVHIFTDVRTRLGRSDILLKCAFQASLYREIQVLFELFWNFIIILKFPIVEEPFQMNI